MEKLQKIDVSELTEELYNQYPVWRWADEEAGFEDHEFYVLPVEQLEPLSGEDGALLIKASLITKEGVRLKGNISFSGGGANPDDFSEDVIAIDIWIPEKKYCGFNCRMREFADPSISILKKYLGDAQAEIFPIWFETEFRFADTGKIKGYFDFAKE